MLDVTYRDLLHALYEAVLLCDGEGRLVEANRRAERLFRIPAGAAERVVTDLVPALTPEVLGRVARRLDEGRFTVADVVCTRCDGTSFPAEAAIGRMEPPGGALYVFTVRDVTVRKRAEAALRREAADQLQRARAQEDFSGGLHILSVPDVLQLIEAARKSGVLSVTGAGGAAVASLSFREGRLVAARCGDARGEEAVRRLFRTGGRAFAFRRGEPAETDEGLTSSTMALMLEASRLLDEERAGGPGGPGG